MPKVIPQVVVTLPVEVHEEEEGEGYWAEIPLMPGCYSQADSLDELKARINDAAVAWLECLPAVASVAKAGRRPPPPPVGTIIGRTPMVGTHQEEIIPPPAAPHPLDPARPRRNIRRKGHAS